MRVAKFIGLVGVALLLAACNHAPEITVAVHECAPMPAGRASACACSLDGKAYIFAGREGSKYRNDLWQYDPQTDTWTNLGASPMKARVNATMAAADGKIYTGLGFAGSGVYRDSSYLQDWWEYTPATNEWRRLANYPQDNTVAASSIAINGIVYVLYGFGWGWTREVWKYSIAEDKWTKLPHNEQRAKDNGEGCGAMLNGTYYFGTGYNTYNETQWFAADLTTDSWTKCASIPGKGREISACAASQKYVYLFGGRHFGGDMTGGEIFETYMRYLPEKDQWEWCGTMPCGRAENQIAFTIDDKAYFGLGENDKKEMINTLYRIED